MNGAMPMLYLCAGLALMGVQPAFADEASNPTATESSDVSSDLGVLSSDLGVWRGVYTDSGQVITAGQFLGIGGAVALTIALVSNENEYALPTAALGLGAYLAGPALMAGGSVRQARIIRMVDPESPPPLYGYVTWGLCISGFSVLPLVGTAAGYITGTIQKRKNRLNWNRAMAQQLQNIPRSSFTVDVTPFEHDGSRGLALVGTF